MTAVLIAGANGQVGHELRQRAGARAIALDRTELDIRDRAATLATVERLRPRVVINAAAYTAVDKAEQDRDAAFATNRDGAAHLAEGCARVGAALLHLSTDYVFDGTARDTNLEAGAANPRGVYAQSKWEGEQKIREILPEHVIVRVSWVFGAHGHNFVKTILRLARERPELRVVADQRGCPTSAGSIAEALLQLATRIALLPSPASGEGAGESAAFVLPSTAHGGRGAGGEGLSPWGTCHYTGTPATTWHGFATTIVECAHELGMLRNIPRIHAITTPEYPTPAPRPANSILDCARSAALGLKRHDWRDDLRDVLTSMNLQTA